MNLDMGFDPIQSQNIERLRIHWDTKLRQNKNAPKNARTRYPLAPTDAVLRRIVNEDNYGFENSAFGAFCSTMMVAEMKGVSDRIQSAQVEVLGAGLCRDLDWISEVSLNCREVNIRDVSTFSCELAREKFKYLIRNERVNVLCDEIETVLNHREIDVDRPVVYFGSQFIQVQKPRPMRNMMKRIGAILDNPLNPMPLRVLYLMHPYRVDNETPREWGHTRFTNVVWGDTTPYSEVELCKALEVGSSRPVNITVLGRHDYYHQTYSFLKVEVKKS